MICDTGKNLCALNLFRGANRRADHVASSTASPKHLLHIEHTTIVLLLEGTKRMEQGRVANPRASLVAMMEVFLQVHTKCIHVKEWAT